MWHRSLVDRFLQSVCTYVPNYMPSYPQTTTILIFTAVRISNLKNLHIVVGIYINIIEHWESHNLFQILFKFWF
jgi:hypothetical protein